MTMGIVSQRQKRRRRRSRLQAGRRLVIASLAALVGTAMLSPQMRTAFGSAWAACLPAVGVFAAPEAAQAEITLPAQRVYALQLGVFDSGDRAAAEAKRLAEAGVPCMVWQRDKMRIVSAVAQDRESLRGADTATAEGYVIEDETESVTVRITAQADRIERVRELLLLPDAALAQLLDRDGAPLKEIVSHVREKADPARTAHPENGLYTRLAEGLMSWCEWAERAGARAERSCAAAAMYALCRELRLSVSDQASEASTASAQRTPSTAAEVMPPA